MKWFTSTVAVLGLLALAGLGWAYSGSYNIAADEPHWALTTWALAGIRDRSVEVRSKNLEVPDLQDTGLVAMGAGHYAEMCADCHRVPGATESEIRRGLYPRPPDLTRFAPDPAEAFWVIKHGIKMSAMPAWGVTHDDAAVWAIVAFLQRLPTLDADAYAALTEASGEDHEHADHMHGDDDAAAEGEVHDGEAALEPAVPHTHSESGQPVH